MSKYGSMLPDAPASSNCKLFLARTLSHHDTTMNHPLMVSIYDRKVTDRAYAHYLKCMLCLFSIMEENEAVLKVLPDSLLDERLNRVAALKVDLKGLGVSDAETAENHSNKEFSPAVKKYFAELFSEDQLQNRNEMICHHFLHYNAMLSGGAFLGSCLQRMTPPRPNAIYKFDLGPGKPGHEYVRDYMAKVDEIRLTTEEQERMVKCMLRIYELTEEMMEEAQALQPDVVRPPPSQNEEEAKRIQQPFERKISLEVLRQHDGKRKKEDGTATGTWICIGGRVLDVSKSSSYCPGGPYELFAGHEISKSLSEMSLEPADLDDLSFDARSKAVTWATKLGRAYPVVGTLVDFPPENRLPEEVFDYDPDNNQLDSLERPSQQENEVVENQAPAAADKCPITGKPGSACPMGFTGEKNPHQQQPQAQSQQQPQKKDGEGECPFPFIYLHDPKHGVKRHPLKSLAIVLIFGALAYRRFAPRAA